MLVFGTGSGRCGTMTLANLLNAEPDVVCTHEGKFRKREETGEQVIPFLTLQNLIAYHEPAQAISILKQTRSNMEQSYKQFHKSVVADIAYNYVPFIKNLPELYPDAKLIVMFRDGRDFVRSAYVDDVPDLTPVGWPDPEKELTKLERYIEIGRWRPLDSDAPDSEWRTMDSFEKNCWLWAETNKVLLNSIEYWNPKNVLILKFEEFFSDVAAHYATVRKFLELDGNIPDTVLALINKPVINVRLRKKIPKWTEWDSEIQAKFDRQACSVMEKLDYS